MLQLPVAKDFYPGKMATDEVRFAQQLFVHSCPGLKSIKILKVHDRVVLMKGGIVEPALWQSPDQRHLPAFESEPDAAARTRFLSLMTLAACLSMPGTFTATKPLDTMSRTGTRPQVMKMHHDCSAFPSPVRIPRTFKI